MCGSCGAPRPVEHTYCFACGVRLAPAVLASNKSGFKQRGLGMGYGRIKTTDDVRGGRPARTWGDTLARWYLTASLASAAVLWASSRGLLPESLWTGVSAVVRAIFSGAQ